jgi:hypothetical protein
MGMGMDRFRWIACVVSVVFTGCVAQVDDPESLENAPAATGFAEEEVGSSSAALLAGWATGPFTWVQGEPVRRMEKLDTHVCVLTGMAGKFRGTGEWVHVTDDGTHWTVGGGSLQSGVAADATCFRRSDFTANGSARAIGDYVKSAKARDVPGCLAFKDVPETALSDTFVFLQGIQGQLAGAGEWAFVEQSLSTATRTRLLVNTCVRGQSLIAYALSYRVGNMNRLATFMNTKGGRGDVYDVPEFEAVGTQEVRMAPADKAMCGLTRIQGEFMGAGESISIRVRDGFWTLRTQQAGASEYVRAHARCFARRQAD